MDLLHRHRLVRLTPAGWRRILARAWDADAGECLRHWAAHDLPLVVTRQPAGAPHDGGLALGLPAPAGWGRRRLALQVPRADVSSLDTFPRLEAVVGRWPEARRRPWERVRRRLDACGATARVYGSHGWQHLTGLDHVHAGSDIDLWIAVPDAGRADAAVEVLQACPAAGPRADGELAFPDGDAVAWREWQAWRTGRTTSLLVKRLDGCAVRREGCGAPPVAPAYPPPEAGRVAEARPEAPASAT